MKQLSNIKKYSVIISIAILFSVFCYSLVDIFLTRPEYNDYCTPNRDYLIDVNESCDNIVPSEADLINCSENNGNIDFIYQEGCRVDYFCNTCHAGYDEEMASYSTNVFYAVSFFGIIAILWGLYVKTKNVVLEWVYSGFLIGGIITLLSGTLSYYSNLDKYAKPIVILSEMILIILITLKLNNKK